MMEQINVPEGGKAHVYFWGKAHELLNNINRKGAKRKMTTIFSGSNRIQVYYGVFGIASGRNHKGVDVDTLPDEDIIVHSTVAGRVKWARKVEKGASGWGDTWQWGNFVWVVADNSTEHIFAHLKDDSILVNEGQEIHAGQALGTMGMTGNAVSDIQVEHVHYEVRRGGVAIDPTPWCGGCNKVGVWPSVGYMKGEDNVYRLYQVVFASKDKASAQSEFNNILNAGGRPGFDCAGSDGQYRVGVVVMAKEDPVQLFGEIDENYFIG